MFGTIAPRSATTSWSVLYIIKMEGYGWRQHKAAYSFAVSAPRGAFVLRNISQTSDATPTEAWCRGRGWCRVQLLQVCAGLPCPL